jgi:hypothetical protein
LRRCVPQPMNGGEIAAAEATFRELDYLLASQTWETDAPVIRIGPYFASLRQKKHLTMEAVANYLKKDIRAVSFVELALVEGGGTSFQSSTDYARLLGFTLSDIFNDVVSGVADNTMRRQRSMLSEGELLEKIKVAAEILRSRGEFVTKAAIGRIADISSHQLCKYASTKACFEQLARENKSIEGRALLRRGTVNPPRGKPCRCQSYLL